MNFAIALLLPFIAVSTTAPTTGVADPKAAAISFNDAMNAGDAEGVKATCTGTDDVMAAATALAQNVAAEKKLSDAARAKFGDDAARLVAKPDFKAFYFFFDKPTLKVDTVGDSCKLTVDNHPKPFLTLKLIGDQWRVELSSIPFLAKNPSAVQSFESRSAKVKSDLAEEIAIGKYSTAEDAHRAFGEMLAKAEGKK